MAKYPDDDISYWKSSVPGTQYPTLSTDVDVDVAIVGGGITGLTTAYLLKRSGLKVAVVEKNTIGSGTTGGTTGKVTSQHGIIYDEITSRMGQKAAQAYATANQTALKQMAKIIKDEKIDCSWQSTDNYIYTTDNSKIRQFASEAIAAAKLGLPASFETQLELPFSVEAAIKFTGQATFNVLKYVLALAKTVNGDGSYVFENSNVNGFHDGTRASINTKKATITAKDIIVTTKVPASPLIARGAYCLKEYPHTSYIVAGRFKGRLKGMYISPDAGHYSILPVSDGRERLLLIGGENHIPGLGNAEKRYQKLARYADQKFGVSSISYRWKAMDYIAYDNVPLIGKLYPWSEHLYVATAFRKWGLTTSMVAGMILHDQIMGIANPWASTFDSLRLGPIASIPRTIAKSFS